MRRRNREGRVGEIIGEQAFGKGAPGDLADKGGEARRAAFGRRRAERIGTCPRATRPCEVEILPGAIGNRRGNLPRDLADVVSQRACLDNPPVHVLRGGAFGAQRDIEHEVRFGNRLTGQNITGVEFLPAQRIAEGRDGVDFARYKAAAAATACANRAIMWIGKAERKRGFEHRMVARHLELLSSRLQGNLRQSLFCKQFFEHSIPSLCRCFHQIACAADNCSRRVRLHS